TVPRTLVMDPFAGSNTTGFAAESLKRRWISIESRSDYVASSLARFLQPRWTPKTGQSWTPENRPVR
ncbi:MAG: DNA methyltransferase, partial [Gemmatimonadales bacterium]